MTPVATGICFVIPQRKICVFYGHFERSKQTTWSSANNVRRTV